MSKAILITTASLVAILLNGTHYSHTIYYIEINSEVTLEEKNRMIKNRAGLQ